MPQRSHSKTMLFINMRHRNLLYHNFYTTATLNAMQIYRIQLKVSPLSIATLLHIEYTDFASLQNTVFTVSIFFIAFNIILLSTLHFMHTIIYVIHNISLHRFVLRCLHTCNITTVFLMHPELNSIDSLTTAELVEFPEIQVLSIHFKN